MLRAVIFDCDGTIADNEPLHLRMFQEVLSEEGIVFTEKEYYAKYLGMDDKDCFTTVLMAYERTVNDEILDDLIQRKARLYEVAIRRDLKLYPGIVEFIRSAHRCYRLAVASGALRHEIRIILETAELADCFQVIVAAEDVRAGKPDPEGFRKALEGMNTHPPLPDQPILAAECLVIEDSFAGVEAARAAGMKCLATTHTYSRSVLKDADHIVDTFSGLTIAELEALFP
jgi:beta-phosphoglucomutase